jgi:hypothetical protein
MDKPKLTKIPCRMCKEKNVWESYWTDYYPEGSTLYHDVICYSCGVYQEQGCSLGKESLQEHRRAVGLETEDEKNIREFKEFLKDKKMTNDKKKNEDKEKYRDITISNREKVSELSSNGVLGICLDVHMANTGSSDPMSKEEYGKAIDALRERLLIWTENPIKSFSAFDDAVKNLITTTILEVSSLNPY